MGKNFLFWRRTSKPSGNDVEIYDLEADIWTQSYRPEVCEITNSDWEDCNGLYGGAGSRYVTLTGKPYTEHSWDFESHDRLAALSEF